MRALYRAQGATDRFLAAISAAAKGLVIQSFDHWHPKLDEALQRLPETQILPHELFRQLVQNPGPSTKRVILVKERGEPVAVAGLRQNGDQWEPLTHWIVPEVLFPVKEGYVGRTLAALGLNLRIAWWRWESPPPSIPGMRDLHSTPTHGMLCSEDFEAFWRKTRHLRKIRTQRNRCSGFEFRVDSPGSREWTIRNCEAKWRPEALAMSLDLPDRLLVAKYLEKRGLYHTIALYDRSEPIAGGTFLIHRNDAVAHMSYRDPSYDFYGVMNRLTDLAFSWASRMGFRKIDLGGSFHYKIKWAPEDGEKWEFSVCPSFITLENTALGLAHQAWSRLNRHFENVRNRA